MTREEAIELLDNLIGMVEDNHNSDYDTAFNMAIKALEQEPCEDAISKQSVLNACEQSINILEAVDRIMDLPPVNPQPKTGHWMIVHRKGIYTHLVCDKCLSNAPYDCRTNYCPNCGAKMVEPQERSDKE